MVVSSFNHDLCQGLPNYRNRGCSQNLTLFRPATFNPGYPSFAPEKPVARSSTEPQKAEAASPLFDLLPFHQTSLVEREREKKRNDRVSRSWAHGEWQGSGVMSGGGRTPLMIAIHGTNPCLSLPLSCAIITALISIYEMG